MTIDLGAALRRVKPEKQLEQLRQRPADQFVSAADLFGPGRPELLLDTNVYILSAAGRLPSVADDLIERSLLFHCSVCIAELALGVGNADPTASGWKRMASHYSTLIATLPPTRILVPDDDIWVEAGLIAGTLARTQNFQRHQRNECLSDALIYLTATSAGLPVLTTNQREFNLIQQLATKGRVVHF